MLRATYIGDSGRVAALLAGRVSGLLVNPITDSLSGVLLITRRALTPAPFATAAAPVVFQVTLTPAGQ